MHESVFYIYKCTIFVAISGQMFPLNVLDVRAKLNSNSKLGDSACFLHLKQINQFGFLSALFRTKPQKGWSFSRTMSETKANFLRRSCRTFLLRFACLLTRLLSQNRI